MSCPYISDGDGVEKVDGGPTPRQQLAERHKEKREAFF
jgi:hypothetical protein